jgi:signal peptide peptidase SppA
VETTTNPTCFNNHLGYWLCQPEWLAQAVAHVKAGTWSPTFHVEHEARHLGEDADLFGMAADGIAVIPIMGPMMKGQSKFGGNSTLQTRRAIRQADATEEVRGILLHIDSPGGHVAGTQELADDVAATKKPINAHIDDLGASAAFWVASRADRITANKMAEIGSIGVIGVLEDSTGAAEQAGIEVHVITTGPFKGMGIPGTPVTDAHLGEAQRLVDGIFSHFKGDVSRGRGLSGKALDAVSDGRVFLADQAKRLGLIDEVQSLDTALATGFPKAPRRRAARAWLDSFLTIPENRV